MNIKIQFSIQSDFNFLIIAVFFLLSLNNINAQCAGDNASFSVCDIPNSSSSSINLFNLLGGSPVAGGTWNDDDFSDALNINTGILNAQLIKQSGIYNFTYTVSGGPGCVDNTATVTVTIGGYAGVSGADNSTCSDVGEYNLFQLFDGNFLNPQSNGTWSDDDGSGFLGGSILDVENAIGDLDQRTLRFTYRIAAIESCPQSVAAQASVTIYRAAKPGNPSDLILCDTEVSDYTNLDLNSLLAGEDAGGRWSDGNNPSTMELTNPLDRTINVQNLGIGTFNFSYIVWPKSTICRPKTATVKIIIEELLDFTGATLVINSDICENEINTATYSAILTQGAQNIPDGQYEVSYTVSGPNGTSIHTVRAFFNDGILTFILNRQLFNRVGGFTVIITRINNVNSFFACDNIINNLFDVLNVYPLPVLTSSLSIGPICQGQSAAVSFLAATNLPNGDYSITYNLTGNNSASNQTAVVTATGGILNGFSIPANLIPNSGNSTPESPGNTVIRLISIRNLITNCSNSVSINGILLIKPIPVIPDFSIVVSDICQNEPVSVVLLGLGNLRSIIATYNLSGANTADNQTAALIVNSGNGSFIIPQSLMTNTGATIISIILVTNTETTCGIAVNKVTNFIVYPLLDAPVANNLNFCETENATIGNLLPNGNQYQWFNTATATSPLSNNIALVTGNYYLKEINTSTKCTSPASMITVTINRIERPALNPGGQNFCGAENPTIQNLSDNIASNETVIWFDLLTGGNQLSVTTLLQDSATYYGFGFSNITNCFSVNGLPVTVSLANCDVIPNFFIPDGFSPNGDGVNDTFTIPDIEFIYPDYSLEIYNRYGNLMFKGNKDKPDWDGNSLSNVIDAMAPNGVYFYVLYYNKGTISPKQGRLYLNR